jgi:hypothetical protein
MSFNDSNSFSDHSGEDGSVFFNEDDIVGCLRSKYYDRWCTTSRRSSWAFLAGKKKFARKRSYEKFYRESVPEKPLRTHHDKLSSIISNLSVATMGIFP